MAARLLEMKNISKSFPGVQALSEVDFNVDKGEVHALVGENGAGKSTLMKVLTGIHPDYEKGKIIYKGEEVHFKNPAQAQEAGLAIIHQELELIPELTVAENVFLGREPGRGWINKKKLKAKTKEIFTELGIEINLNKKIKHLTIGKQQMVEIAKAISQDAEIIAMDEPTSSLSQQEVKLLFSLIEDLKEEGIGIIYISHHLDEVFEICDRVTVLRDGHKIKEQSVADTNRDEIVKQMVGREVENRFPDFEIDDEKPIFKVENLSVPELITDVSFEVRKGEIFGLAGLMGAGRSEIARAIYGVFKNTKGDIYLNDKKLNIKSPKDAIENGIYYLTENRKEEGLIPELSVGENISLSILEKLTFIKSIISKQKEKSLVKEFISKLDVRTPGPWQLIRNLSGGNQQKALLGRVLSTNPKLIIMDEPTRGIDVGAKQEIYKLMEELAAEGVTIIFISSELPEILNLTSRVGVVYKGRLQGVVAGNEISEEKIMNLATGGNS